MTLKRLALRAVATGVIVSTFSFAALAMTPFNLDDVLLGLYCLFCM